ncbi:MAG TPA: DNA recombination protein RmuC [Bacteroidota bacterium]
MAGFDISFTLLVNQKHFVDFLTLILLVFIVILAGVVLYLLFRKASNEPSRRIDLELHSLKEAVDRTERLVNEEIGKSRVESERMLRSMREELGGAVSRNTDSQLTRMSDIAQLQKNQLDTFAQQLSRLTDSNEQKLDGLRTVVENKLKLMLEENSQKLEQMRATVDEKLHNTLERRLGESFRIVSERLEQVHQGLGDMQSLAAGVGDLKKVLTNVKARGTWGEFQLGGILEQMLSPDQYAKNVATRPGASERVEYAVRMPGQSGVDNECIWLPIDAKFPQEDYHRLVEAQENANPVLVEEAAKQLESRIKAGAKAIREKYIAPPYTTDFGIMFLPIESLYAEILRRPGLAEVVQREYRVTIAGPTTLAALLNSLQMGFRTLAIEKRSSEVWALLGSVKTEFGKFGEVLARTQKKLQEASNTIDDAATRTRVIERKLRDVHELPAGDGQMMIGFNAGSAEEKEQST